MRGRKDGRCPYVKAGSESLTSFQMEKKVNLSFRVYCHLEGALTCSRLVHLADWGTDDRGSKGIEK
jgi:hypothetical protein